MSLNSMQILTSKFMVGYTTMLSLCLIFHQNQARYAYKR